MPASKAPKRNRSKPDDPAYERIREKIKTPQILERLQKHVLGEKDANGVVKMSSTQMAAAKILLDKTMPNLQSTELTGKNGGPLIPTVNIYGNSDKPK